MNLVLLKKHKIISKKKFFILVLFCVCSLSSQSQKMNNHLYKVLITKIGDICMETPDDNPCSGSQIFLTLLFDKKQVQVSEKEISSCSKVSILKIGTYNWEFMSNKKIKVYFISEETKGTYAEQLFLELRNKQVIGHLTHLNGKTVEYVFKEE